MRNVNPLENIRAPQKIRGQIFTFNFTFRMDENKDGNLTEEEFLKGCLQDDELSKMLAPNVAT